jgi:DNA-binding response OmpR family regulator
MSAERTILVVDDESQLRLTLSLLLQKGGHRVVTAADGAEALNYLKVQPYDLMFMDLNMPGISGVALLSEIHRQLPKMPVLILTAHATLETAIQAVKLGARDYLIKPVEPEFILARVAEILSEEQQPVRKKEIVSQVQTLLAELQQLDGEDATPTSALAALPPTDAARFLNKGAFTLDLHARHVMFKNAYVPITGIYFDYLVTLLQHAPKTVSYKILVKEAQGFNVELTEAKELTRWRIYELRKLLEPNPQEPQYILTVRGAGYRLVV